MKITGIRSGLILTGVLIAVGCAAAAVSHDVQLRHSIANAETLLRRQAKTPAESSEIAWIVLHLPADQQTYAARWSPTGYATLGVAGTLAGVFMLVVALRRPR